jgi:hypothetical protein
MYRPAITLVIAKVALGASLALASPPCHTRWLTPTRSRATTRTPRSWATTTATASLEGESGWSCVDDGNKVCGPNNPQGVPAGRYDEGGVLIDPWPVN